MKTLTKILGTGILAVSLIGIAGCGEVQSPYHPAGLVEVANCKEKNKQEKVVVEGIPSLVREDGFVLRDGDAELYVSRNRWTENGAYGNYLEARKALIEHAAKKEKVRVYGIAAKDKTLEARFVDIDGTLYEIYE